MNLAHDNYTCMWTRATLSLSLGFMMHDTKSKPKPHVKEAQLDKTETDSTVLTTNGKSS